MKLLQKPALRYLASGVAAVLLFSATATAKVANPKVVPAKSVYVLSIPDVPAFWAVWKQNAVYGTFKKYLESSEIGADAETFNKLIKNIETELKFGLDGDTLSKVVKSVDAFVVAGANAGQMIGGCVVTVSDPEKFGRLMDFWEKAAEKAVSAEAEKSAGDESPKANDEGAGKAPKAVKAGKEPTGGADASDQPAKPDETTTEPAMAQTSSQGAITTETYKSVIVKGITTANEGEMYYAMVDNMFLASSGRSEIKAMIDRASGELTIGAFDTLSEYEKVEAGLAARPGEAYIYVNQKQALDVQNPVPGMAKFQEFIKNLSPWSLSGVSAKINAANIGMYSYAPFSPGSEGSMMRQLLEKNPGNAPLEIVEFAPAECLVVYGTSLLDSFMLYDVAKDLLGAMGGMSGNQLDEQLKQLEPMLGFSIKGDLLPALGNEVGFFLNNVKTGGILPSVDAGLILRIRDKDKMNKVLAGIEKGVNDRMKAMAAVPGPDEKAAPPSPGFKSATEDGLSIKYIEIPNVPTFTPGFAVDGNYLIIGTTKSVISGFSKVKAGKDKGLTSSDLYKSLGPGVSTRGNGFVMLNFEGVWKTVTEVAGALPNAEGVQKVVEALKVLKVVGGNSMVKDQAVSSESVVVFQ